MSRRKRQFKHKKNKPELYDRKVQRSGTSVVLSVTKLLPKDWLYVRIVPLMMDEKQLVVRILPLWTVDDDARAIENNKVGKQDT